MEIPNVPIYADKGKFGAVRAYTRGDAEVKQIPKLEWDKLRVGMFCMDARSLGDYKTFIEKACQKNQNCVDGVRRIVDSLEANPAAPAKGGPAGGVRVSDEELEKLLNPGGQR